MSNPIKTIANNVKNLRKTLSEVVLDIVQTKEMIVLDMNREQLYSGKDSLDNPITPPYTISTKMAKIRKGQPTNRVTLKDTGEYYREMAIIYGDDRFGIYSDAEHTKYLTGKYGNEIHGLNEDNIDELSLIVSEAFESIGIDLLLKGVNKTMV